MDQSTQHKGEMNSSDPYVAFYIMSGSLTPEKARLLDRPLWCLDGTIQLHLGAYTHKPHPHWNRNVMDSHKHTVYTSKHCPSKLTIGFRLLVKISWVTTSVFVSLHFYLDPYRREEDIFYRNDLHFRMILFIRYLVWMTWINAYSKPEWERSIIGLPDC